MNIGKEKALKIKAILFDYDGTLLDSIGEVYRGTCNVFRKCGIQAPSFKEFCETYESPYHTYYLKHGITASDEDVVRWYFEEARHDDQLFFSDVPSVMNVLTGRGMVMGIISAHYQDKISVQCRRAGLHRHFRSIIGRAHDKVDSIKDFCLNQRVDPAETLYIGDFVSDVRDAKKAGVIAVGITRGKETSGVLLKAGADHCIAHLHELLPLLD